MMRVRQIRLKLAGHVVRMGLSEAGIILCECGAGGVMDPDTRMVGWVTHHLIRCPAYEVTVRIPHAPRTRRGGGSGDAAAAPSISPEEV